VVSKAHTAKHKLPCSIFLALGREKEAAAANGADRAAIGCFAATSEASSATRDTAGELPVEMGRTRFGLPVGAGSSLFSGEGVALALEPSSFFADAASVRALRFFCKADSVARLTTVAGT
jgi:hypothetical protein